MEKYIKNAIYWNGKVHAWLRISDLNLVTRKDEIFYTPAHMASSAVLVINKDCAFPYEEWMNEYIGTDKNLKEAIITRTNENKP